MKARECPFCESRRVEAAETEIMGKKVLRIRCMACGAEGPVNYASESTPVAVTNWNRRAEFRSWTEVE